MSRLNDRIEASNQRLQNRQQGLQNNINNRINNARNNLNARDSRRINELVGDLTSLGPGVPPPTLRKEEPRGGIPAARGYAERAYQPGTGGGGGTAGIASPLTEQERTYAPEPVYVEAMDGSGYFRVRPIVQMKMTDAEDREIVFDFAERAGSL